jgi:ubiquitin-protein ligase E3 A
LKKQLKVQFVGEEAVDEGGVQKEFFQLVVREIFDTKYGIFSRNESSGLYWFVPQPSDDEVGFEELKLVGRLIGLAIYNGVILDIHFPVAVYKKLMDVPVTLGDLAQLDPVYSTIICIFL